METEKKSDGALFGSIVIIIIIIIGGIYVWQSKVQRILEEKKKIELENAKALEQLKALENDISNADTNVDIDTNKIK